MKNKTVIILLSVLAVAMYTVAVINFCMGDVLMASFGALMAYALYRVGQLGRMADRTGKAVIGLLEQLTKGVPATLTVKDGKGTITLGHGEDELRGRYERMSDFLASDKCQLLSETSRTLLFRQHQAMHDYLDVLTQRLRIEAKEANLKIDIEEPDTDTAE